MYCVNCTFLNPPNSQICEMCSKSLNPVNPSNVNEDLNTMVCNACTFMNSSEANTCGMCGSDLHFKDSFIVVDDYDVLENLIQMGEPFAKKNVVKILLQMKQLFKVLTLDENRTINEAIIDQPRKCEICYGPIESNYFAMFECIHTFCHDCAVKYFTIRITEQPILDCSCPMCNTPDLRSNRDKHSEYFSLLLASLRPILDENVMNVFEKKLTDLALLSDPNFVWCIRCTSGFVNTAMTKVLYCRDCRVRFCIDCKKEWEPQHQNLSCEQFANWQRDNDPELSQEAIGNYLRKNGIDCPKCKFRFDLSREGCIHFTCTQCKYEFCFGCSKTFVRQCTISSYCKQLGLHAHHQRNCFYYLRDKSIADLQGLLQINKIKFMVDTAENEAQSKSDAQMCPIELQIDAVDTLCREPAEGGHAGLCKKHYKEYLIVTITKHKLETNSILTVQNYHELLRIQGIAIPTQSIDQNESEYKAVCEKLVKNNILLDQ